MTFKELLGKKMLFFDGATGTQLQARGLKPGELPESWNFTHPEIVEAVHRGYLDVGSNIVKSNTFGANPIKLKGSGLDCKETIEAAVAIAKRACGGRENNFVALNLGPTGKLLAPYGDLAFEDAVAAYGEMVRYGAAAGADLILVETMSDTYEIKAAVLAAKENCDLPICVTMTFDQDGKLLTGATVEAAALMCEGLGVDAPRLHSANNLAGNLGVFGTGGNGQGQGVHYDVAALDTVFSSASDNFISNSDATSRSIGNTTIIQAQRNQNCAIFFGQGQHLS